MFTREATKIFSFFWVIIALAIFLACNAGVMYLQHVTNTANLSIAQKIGNISSILALVLFGVGLAGVLFSLKAQFLAIMRMQKKMQVQQHVLHNQKTKLKNQNEIARIQYFESSFFKLLSTFDNQRSNFIMKDTIYNKEGKMEELSFFPFLSALYGNKGQGINYGLSLQTIYPKGETYIAFPVRKKWIEKVFAKHINIDKLRNYFLYLYNIIKFIDTHNTFAQENNIEDSEELKKMKIHYLDIVLASLSQVELLLLFYNSLCSGKMKDLVEEYHLLKNLELSSLPCQLDVCLYKKSAFADDSTQQQFDDFTTR